MNIRQSILAAVAAAACLPTAYAQDSGSWLVRGRALYLDSANKDNTGLDLSVNNKTFPELDITYFLNNNLAVELVLTYPQKHDIRAGGTKIGTLKHLPPTLSLQYHFPMSGFRPYVGAGINYTKFYDINLLAGAATVDSSSWGGALQIGVDIPLDKKFFLNFDLKKIWIDTDVKLTATGATAANFKINPLIFGMGVGMKF